MLRAGGEVLDHVSDTLHSWLVNFSDPESITEVTATTGWLCSFWKITCRPEGNGYDWSWNRVLIELRSGKSKTFGTSASAGCRTRALRPS